MSYIIVPRMMPGAGSSQCVNSGSPSRGSGGCDRWGWRWYRLRSSLSRSSEGKHLVHTVFGRPELPAGRVQPGLLVFGVRF